MKYDLTFYSYCGMSNKIVEDGDIDKCRSKAAKVLRSRRNNGHFVTKVDDNKWECQEPEDCSMIPDSAGTLVLSVVETDDEDEYEEEE